MSGSDIADLVAPPRCLYCGAQTQETGRMTATNFHSEIAFTCTDTRCNGVIVATLKLRPAGRQGCEHHHTGHPAPAGTLAPRPGVLFFEEKP